MFDSDSFISSKLRQAEKKRKEKKGPPNIAFFLNIAHLVYEIQPSLVFFCPPFPSL